jgi:hypothetical protein
MLHSGLLQPPYLLLYTSCFDLWCPYLAARPPHTYSSTGKMTPWTGRF